MRVGVRTRKVGEMSEEQTAEVGIYWHPAVWDLARSAYVADLDTDDDSPGSFVGWLDRALDRHARRTPAERAALADTARRDDTSESRKPFNRAHHLGASTVQAAENAIITDRGDLGRMVSVSEFVREAVVAAAADARRRYGRDLPPPPARLSNRPPRRRTLR
jgi:hypothetical protein